MIRVITYGTYDLLHHGHIRLLERAKALGDYLIVGVTADSFDLTRGKINVQQSLIERVEAVRATGIADEIIVEEYEGQKIDDIKRYEIDIFTVGSDWLGQFDYLQEYCKVVYLDRTQGISSTEIRSKRSEIRLGVVGSVPFVNKFYRESQYVNGVEIVGVCTDSPEILDESVKSLFITNDLKELLTKCDALYFINSPVSRYADIENALNNGKHVLCESPICVSISDWINLKNIADEKGCILMDAIRTAYATAFSRLILLVKSGKIGDVVSVDATCTSLRTIREDEVDYVGKSWNSICTWGPPALLPIFYLLGTDYTHKIISSKIIGDKFDVFTKIAFTFPNAVASIKVGVGVKSEGELIISGTKGYVYVPAPWWKTDYFEIRFENPTNNKRYFYQLDGEGIRNELVTFVKCISSNRSAYNVEDEVSLAIVKIMEDYFNSRDLIKI